ncbi:hypothetical protein Hanom_Chr01g00087231 [Helianthus anomalus]
MISQDIDASQDGSWRGSRPNVLKCLYHKSTCTRNRFFLGRVFVGRKKKSVNFGERVFRRGTHFLE